MTLFLTSFVLNIAEFIVQALIALGTISAVIVALFKEKLFSRYSIYTQTLMGILPKQEVTCLRIGIKNLNTHDTAISEIILKLKFRKLYKTYYLYKNFETAKRIKSLQTRYLIFEKESFINFIYENYKSFVLLKHQDCNISIRDFIKKCTLQIKFNASTKNLNITEQIEELLVDRTTVHIHNCIAVFDKSAPFKMAIKEEDIVEWNKKTDYLIPKR